MSDPAPAMPPISTHLGYFGTGATVTTRTGHRPPSTPSSASPWRRGPPGLQARRAALPDDVRERAAGGDQGLPRDPHLACSIVSVSVWDEAGGGWSPSPTRCRRA